MNDISAPTPRGIPGRAPGRSRRKLVLAILVVLCAGLGAFLIFRSEAPLPSVIILPDFPPPRRSFGVLSRLPPSAQTLFYRLKHRLFGPPTAVNLNASILHFELPLQTLCSKLSLGKADLADTNGLQVWILPTNDLQKLYLHAASLSEIEQLSSPQISTAHGIRARISATKMVSVNGGQRAVGMAMDCLPYVRKNSIDLTTVVTLTGATTTNASALRMQIPNQSGALILQENASRSGGKGIFISPRIWSYKAK